MAAHWAKCCWINIPSKEEADWNEFYQVSENDRSAIILQNEMVEEQALIKDGVCYFDLATVHKYMNEVFYADITFNDTKVKMKIIELKRNGDNMKTDIFGMMFFKMSKKHTKRIMGYEATRPFWHFFDLKAYIIMACMMGGGIGFRAAGIFPDIFIAFFYSGLGCALA